MGKSNGVDRTASGKKRVRLNDGSLNSRAHVKGRRKPSREHLEKMWAARDKARAEAPRHGRGKGFPANNHRYKQLMSIYKDNPHAPPKNVFFDSESKEMENRRNLPLFIKKPKVADKMIELLERGIPPGTVCRSAGIGYETFKRWLVIGSEGLNPLYTEFFQRVAKAESQAEINLIDKMEAHHEKEWKSIAWTLERRWPENWARRDRHEVSGELVISKKEKLAERVVDDPETLDLARKLLEDGSEIFAVPEQDELIDEDEEELVDVGDRFEDGEEGFCNEG